MDPNLIYVKTAAGENAIQQRTRVIQRNIRMVLILVDGQSSVADLARKTGNLQLTENALAELEKGGFIELKVEQHDSLWEESKRVAQEIRSAAVEKVTQFSAARESRGEYPDFQQSAPSRPSDDAKNQASDMPISLHSIFDAKDAAEFSTSRFSLPPGLGTLKQSIPGDEVRQNADKRRRAARKDDPPVAKPSFVAQFKSMWAGADRLIEDEPVKLKPVRRSSGGGAGWLAWVFFGLAGVLVLGYAGIRLFPFSIFVSRVETAVSSAIGRPVGIQELRVDISPAPALVLDGVRLGQGDEAISVREIRLQPDLASLFSERQSLRKVVVSGAQLRLERIAGMPAMFAALSDPEKSPKISYILLEHSDVSFSGMTLKDAEAEIRLNEKGAMQALEMRAEDKSLILVAEPAAGGINLTVEGFDWRPGADPKFRADSLNFKGRLEKDTLTISSLEIRALDGLVRGNAVVRAGGAKPNLSGNVAFERINGTALGDVLGIGKRLAGGIAGKMRFTARAETWPAIFSAIDGEGEFSIQRGSLYGIDLAEAARRVSGTPVQGGTTAFEQMSGRMRLAREKNQFYDLNIASGLMQSTGYVDVAGKGRVTGRLELQMKGSVNQTRMPVLVSGTLDTPAVQVVERQ